MSGVVAPTMMNPVPPRAISA
jgi:hypothetical protein